MKKAISALLICVMLLSLCACDTMVDSPAAVSGQQSEAVMPEGPKDMLWTEITLHISFGPEIELVINDCYGILSAKLLNEEAQKLLSDMKLENRYYYLTMKEVMQKAYEQGLLKNATRIKVEAESRDSSVWTMMTKELLSRPVEHFQQETGAAIMCTVKLPAAAPQPLDRSCYNKETFSCEEYDAEFYVDGQYNYAWYYEVRRDGSTVEHLYREPGKFCGSIVQESDGSFRHTLEEGNTQVWVWEGLQGSMNPGYACGRSVSRFIRVDGEMINATISYYGYEADGSYFETEYDEYGKIIRNVRKFLDGVTEITTYTDGWQSAIECIAAEGQSIEVPFLNIYEERTYTAEYYQRTYDENGDEKYTILKYGDAYAERCVCDDNTIIYRIVDGEKNWEIFFVWDGSFKLTKVVADGVTYKDEESMRYYVDNAF